MQTDVDALVCKSKGDAPCQALGQAVVGERHLQAEWGTTAHGSGGGVQGSPTVDTLPSCCGRGTLLPGCPL